MAKIDPCPNSSYLFIPPLLSKPMNSWDHYLNSFLDSKVLYSFLIDAGFWLIITILFVLFGLLMQSKGQALGVQSPEDLQRMLAASPEQAQQLAVALKSLVLISISGLIILGLVLLFGFSFSRSLIWNLLLKEKQRYWRWNGLMIALIIPAAFFVLILGIIRVLTSTLSSTLAILLGNLLLFTLLIAFLLFISTIFLSFTTKYKVWESIGHGFYLIKAYWSVLWRMFLLSLGTGIILNLLLSSVSQFMTSTVFTIITLGLFILYFCWLRVYLVLTLHTLHGIRKVHQKTAAKP